MMKRTKAIETLFFFAGISYTRLLSLNDKCHLLMLLLVNVGITKVLISQDAKQYIILIPS